jgi:predicted tellurium resistance membrane protein TerC
MGFLRREWPLLLSTFVFLTLMVADYFSGFMTQLTSLTSGRESDLFVSAGVVTVITLAFLEGILGIDNATVLAIQVRHLKPADAHKALTWGVWGAFIFRFVFLLAAGFILQQKWIMAIGGFYLINLAADFFLNNFLLFATDLIILGVLLGVFFISHETIDLLGLQLPVWTVFTVLAVYSAYRFLARRRRVAHTEAPDEATYRARINLARYPLLSAIIAVEWTDILFSFDSIGAGVALTRDFWVLFWGAFFGVTCLRLFAKIFVRLLERYPQLETAAMIAVLLVGAKLAFEAAQDTLKLRLWQVENWQTSLAIVIVFGVAFLIRSRTTRAS